MPRKQPKKRGIDLPLISPRQLDSDEVELIFPHVLRALVGTRWAYRLGNPFVLMQLMGWASIRTAMIYVRSVGRAAEDAVRTQNANGSSRSLWGADPPLPPIEVENMKATLSFTTSE